MRAAGYPRGDSAVTVRGNVGAAAVRWNHAALAWTFAFSARSRPSTGASRSRSGEQAAGAARASPAAPERDALERPADRRALGRAARRRTRPKTLQVHVSRLRKALARRTCRDPRARLRAQRRARGGRRAPVRGAARRGQGELGAGRPDAGSRRRSSRRSRSGAGAPLADLAYEPFAQAEIARLEDLRSTALEQSIEAKLALGRHGEVIGQLEQLIEEHPYRERLRAQLMLALYRADRQADALQAYQNARRQLVEELGIEPGARLRELEAAVLAQDASLAPGAPGAAAAPHGAPTRAADRRRDVPAHGHRGLVGALGGGSGGDGRLARAPRRDHRGCTQGARRPAAEVTGGGRLHAHVFPRASDALACAAELRNVAWRGLGGRRSSCASGSRSTPARRTSATATISARRQPRREAEGARGRRGHPAVAGHGGDRPRPAARGHGADRSRQPRAARPVAPERVFELRDGGRTAHHRAAGVHTRGPQDRDGALRRDPRRGGSGETSTRRPAGGSAPIRSPGSRTILERHGATVEDYRATCSMAVFGVPVLHEDDALRAVRAAVELRQTLPALAHELCPSWAFGSAPRSGSRPAR